MARPLLSLAIICCIVNGPLTEEEKQYLAKSKEHWTMGKKVCVVIMVLVALTFGVAGVAAWNFGPSKPVSSGTKSSNKVHPVPAQLLPKSTTFNAPQKAGKKHNAAPLRSHVGPSRSRTGINGLERDIDDPFDDVIHDPTELGATGCFNGNCRKKRGADYLANLLARLYQSLTDNDSDKETELLDDTDESSEKETHKSMPKGAHKRGPSIDASKIDASFDFDYNPHSKGSNKGTFSASQDDTERQADDIDKTADNADEVHDDNEGDVDNDDDVAKIDGKDDDNLDEDNDDGNGDSDNNEDDDDDNNDEDEDDSGYDDDEDVEEEREEEDDDDDVDLTKTMSKVGTLNKSAGTSTPSVSSPNEKPNNNRNVSIEVEVVKQLRNETLKNSQKVKESTTSNPTTKKPMTNTSVVTTTSAVKVKQGQQNKTAHGTRVRRQNPDDSADVERSPRLRKRSENYDFVEEEYDPNEGYTPWSDWSLCSASCGAGEQQRNRKCVRRHCKSGDLEGRICFTVPCGIP